MRTLAVLFAVLNLGTAFAQSPGASNLFLSVKPQAVVQIRKDPMGPDLVEMTVLDANYPPATLKAQVDLIAKDLQSEARGVQVVRYEQRKGDPTSIFLKASFAVNGLIDGKTSAVRINPIVRSFAGLPKPFTVTGLSIVFMNIVPTASTLGSFSSAAVQVERQTMAPGVEYRVALLSQDPAAYDIPIVPGQTTTVTNPPVERNKPDWTSFLLVALVVLSAGALVYSLLLLTLGRSSRNSPKR